uniref:uncharacterized protein LOC124070716 n=1 Tax=Scatophagus argus TaxID=75038 RepID=UPI001ED83A34|nr:uncharacterized protein LOC124070716 [Scatophagus argus]
MKIRIFIAMDKSQEKGKQVGPSNRYVLCQMPPEWATLPVHKGCQSSTKRSSIAVYTKRRRNNILIYKGFICPSAPAKMPMSVLHPPPRSRTFGMKLAMLQEKLRAEAEAQEETSEPERIRVEVPAASGAPEEHPVEAVCKTPDGEETTIEPKQKIEGVEETDTDFLPLEEILDIEESASPVPPKGGTDDFWDCFEPREDMTIDMDSFCLNSDFFMQLLSPATPADSDGDDFSLENFLNLD